MVTQTVPSYIKYLIIYVIFNICFNLCPILSSANDEFVEPESSEEKENEDPSDTEVQISRLWVDRFSPRHYTELLSDDVSFPLAFPLKL